MIQRGYIYIKFCGMTRLDDAAEAIRAGADMLGFNFYPQSPRYIAPGECAGLVEYLRAEFGVTPVSAKFVGVFVNTPKEEIDAIVRRCSLDLVQLSGDETDADAAWFGERAFKAIRSDGRKALAQIGPIYLQRKTPPVLLVDAASPGLYGGSGLVADWKQAKEIARHVPILLAGGLNSSNVAEAIQTVQPWGVDVASGIEAAPGVKDRVKMVNFVNAVRDVQNRSQ